MVFLKVCITKLWDLGCYPGFAECVMVDALGITHRFQDKVPIFSSQNLTLEDIPCNGIIRCVRTGENPDGTITVDTESPDGIESETGEHRFRVFSCQLTNGETFS